MTRKAAENGGSYEAGWWLSPYHLEKYEFVSWEYYSQYMGNMFETTNQEKIPLPLSIINTGYEYVCLYIIA